MIMEMPLHVCLGFLGDKAHQVDMISLLGRRSGKGHLSLTQGSLYVHSGVPGDRGQ